MLASLATFGIAFVARPIGSALFGHFGDRIGRKATLVAALLTMGVSTVTIGILPTYETIGIAAPALLALCRFGQGLGLGGEWGGAVLLAVENAPPGKRAWYGCFRSSERPSGFCFRAARSSRSPSGSPTISSLHSVGASLFRERRTRGSGTLHPPDDHRDAGVPAGGNARGARESSDAHRDSRPPAHAGARHARVDRNVRPVLPDDGLLVVVGHVRARLQPQHVPPHSTSRRRVLCTDDSDQRADRRARRTPHHPDLGDSGYWRLRSGDGATADVGPRGRDHRNGRWALADGPDIRTARNDALRAVPNASALHRQLADLQSRRDLRRVTRAVHRHVARAELRAAIRRLLRRRCGLADVVGLVAIEETKDQRL